MVGPSGGGSRAIPLPIFFREIDGRSAAGQVQGPAYPFEGQFARTGERDFLLEALHAHNDRTLEQVGHGFAAGRGGLGGLDQVDHRRHHVEHRGVDADRHGGGAEGGDGLVGVGDAAGEVAAIDLHLAVDPVQVDGYVVGILDAQLELEHGLHGLDVAHTHIRHAHPGIFLEGMHRRTAAEQRQRAAEQQEKNNF